MHSFSFRSASWRFFANGTANLLGAYLSLAATFVRAGTVDAGDHGRQAAAGERQGWREAVGDGDGTEQQDGACRVMGVSVLQRVEAPLTLGARLFAL